MPKDMFWQGVAQITLISPIRYKILKGKAGKEIQSELTDEQMYRLILVVAVPFMPKDTFWQSVA